MSDNLEVQFEDHHRFHDLLGHHDEHIKTVERIVGVRIGLGDRTLIIEGDPVQQELAARVLKELYT